MLSPRWLARLTIPILACTATANGAPIASANPTDDAYLAQLRTMGFTWPPDHDQALVGMAHLVCDDLYWGWTPNQIAQQTHAVLDPRGVTIGQVTSMVDLASTTYCPELKPHT